MPNQVAWIGSDGNLWWRQGDQVINAGRASDYEFTQGGLRALNPNTPLGEGSGFAPGVDQISDPNAPAPQQTTSSGGGYSAPVKRVNTAAVGATQSAIDSLGTEMATGNQNIEDSFNSVTGKYNREATKAEGDYGEQTVTNTKNLTKNKQNALVAAAQGRRGLRGTLASLGALSGTGAELADRAVTRGANEDIGEAADAYAGNAQTLDKAIGNFRDEDRERRAEAETQKTNQRTALEGSVAAKRQQFYQKMAELFAEGGDEGSAGTWLNRAGELNNEIASKTRVAATPFTERAAAFTPGDLESYLAGAGDMTVSASNGVAGPVGTPSILAGRKRKKEEEAATV